MVILLGRLILNFQTFIHEGSNQQELYLLLAMSTKNK